MALRSVAALALLLAPALAQGQSCALEAGADPRDGKPIWKFTDDNARGYESRANAACADCGGTLDWDRGRCLRHPSTPGSGASADAGVNAMAAVIAARASGMPVDPSTEAMAFGAGAFALGAQLGDWLEAEARQGRARAAAEAAARAAEQQRRAQEEARQREESWQRLSGELRLESGGDVAMRFDDTHQELAMKFDGADENLDAPTHRELKAKNRQNDFFTTLGAYRDAPVIERRAYARGVTMAKGVKYGPGDARDAALDTAIDAAHGSPAYRQVASKAPVSDTSLQVFQQSNVAERAAWQALEAAEKKLVDTQRASDLADQLVARARSERADAQLMSRLVEAQAAQKSARDRATIDRARAQQDYRFRRDQERAAMLYAAQGALATGKDNGRPYVECSDAPARLARLRQGHRVQEEALRRSYALFASSNDEAAQARRRGKEAVLAFAKSELDGIAGELKPALEQKARWLRALGASRGQRRDLLDLIRQFEEQKGRIDRLIDAARKGAELADPAALKARLRELADAARGIELTQDGIYRALVESGETGQAGESLASRLGGAAGGAAFRIWRLNIDLYAEYAGETIAAGVRDKALMDYDALNYQQKRLEEMVVTLQQGCQALAKAQ